MGTLNEQADHNSTVISVLRGTSPLVDLPKNYAALETEEEKLRRKMEAYDIFFYELSVTYNDL